MQHVDGLETIGDMMDTITINGVEYVPKASAPDVVDSEHVCVIATNGWIFGRRIETADATPAGKGEL